MNRLMLTIMLIAALLVSILSVDRQHDNVIVIPTENHQSVEGWVSKIKHLFGRHQFTLGEMTLATTSKTTVKPKKAKLAQTTDTSTTPTAATVGTAGTSATANGNTVDVNQLLASDWGGCSGGSDRCIRFVDTKNGQIIHITLPKGAKEKATIERRALSQINCATCATTNTTELPPLVGDEVPAEVDAQKVIAGQIFLKLIAGDSDIKAVADAKKCEDDDEDCSEKLTKKQRDQQALKLECKKAEISAKTGKAVGEVDDYETCARETLDKYANSTDPFIKKEMKKLEDAFTSDMAQHPEKWDDDFMAWVNDHSSEGDNIGARVAYRAKGQSMMPLLGVGLASQQGVDPVTAANYVTQARAEVQREGPRFYMGFAQQRQSLLNLQKQYEATLPSPNSQGIIPNVSDMDYQIAQGLSMTPQTSQLFMLREQSQEKNVAAQLKQAGISLDGTNLGSQLGNTNAAAQQTASALTRQAFQWVVGSDDPRGEAAYRGMNNGAPLVLNYNQDLAGLDLCGAGSSIANTSACAHPFRPTTTIQNGTMNAGLFPNNTTNTNPQNFSMPIGRGFGAGRGGTQM